MLGIFKNNTLALLIGALFLNNALANACVLFKGNERRMQVMDLDNPRHAVD